MYTSKFQDIAAFVSVVKQGSFAGAAKQLGLSASAVTKGIVRLEKDLGVQLLTRSTRNVVLTPHSKEFYSRCEHVLAELSEAEGSIRDEATSLTGLLRVVVTGSFARVTLMNELERFLEIYPDIRLEIVTREKPEELIHQGYDLAICNGNLVDSELVRRNLLRSPMAVVASPSYLAKYGAPTVPQDLMNHRCLVGRRGPNWTFRQGNEDINIRVAGRVTLKTGGAHREAVIGGLGIAYASRWRLRQDIASGALVSLLEEYMPDDIPLSVVYSDRRHVPKKVSVFIDFLFEITRSGRSGTTTAA